MGPLVQSETFVENNRPATVGGATEADVWSGINLLIVGPPGCGKLSFARALTRAFDPRASIQVFDFEAERPSQIATVENLEAMMDSNGNRGVGDTVLLRHLHRLPGSLLKDLLKICSGSSERTDGLMAHVPAPTIRATCFEDVPWPVELATELRRVFPCQVYLARAPQAGKYLGRFISSVVANLNDSHGKRITRIDPNVVGALLSRVSGASLHELRNIIERAYFREETECLSSDSVLLAGL